MLFGQKTTEAFTRSAEKYHIRPMAMCCGAYVVRRDFHPTGRRLVAVDGDVLLSAGQVAYGGWIATELVTITHGDGINVHAADIDEIALQAKYARLRALESFLAAA